MARLAAAIGRFSVYMALFIGVCCCPFAAAGQTTQDEFDALIQEWRKIIQSAVEANIRFEYSGRDESETWRDTHNVEIERGKQVIDQLIPVALKLFSELEQPDQELKELVARIAMWQYDHGQYESAYEVGHKLLKIDPSNDFARLLVGMSSLLTNRFGEARQFRAQHGASLALFEPEAIAFENELFSEIELLENNFQQEMALREQEAKADDLPRVQMKTTKGTIMLELFENHAPDTVANFISLVEAKHYDGKIFNRVVNRFMAQAGGFREDQSYHVPGYKIYDEHTRPDARRHFRGVVSMANTGRPNSADAEFFITMVPRPSLDGKYTAFGRVVSGMEAVDRLNRTVRMEEDNKEVAIEGVVPDQIISATVVRKREHEYRPNKFSEPNEE